MVLFSLRSENLFVEQLHYNLPYRWFLDMDRSELAFDCLNFGKIQPRILEHVVAKLFFGK